MTTVIGILFLSIGAIFMLLASVGAIRMPDLLTRMHTVSKASTLGIGLIALSVPFFHPALDVAARAVALVLFIVVTVPVTAHMISRAAYLSGIELWHGTCVDELADHLKAREEEG